MSSTPQCTPKTTPPPILPGATIGVLGGGQLGRMFAIAARAMGYRVACLEPAPDCPTGQVADLELTAAYDDLPAARQLAQRCAAVTVEFENIPAATLDAVAEIGPMRPASPVLHIAQNRLREKGWLRANGFPTAPFEAVAATAGGANGPAPAGVTLRTLADAVARVGLPAILKTADFGYDGKGQHRLATPTDAERRAAALAAEPDRLFVLEGVVPFEREISVIVARSPAGDVSTFPVFENQHVAGILDLTLCPARVPAGVAERAVELARAIAERIGLVGVLCVELFVTADGAVRVNELAPRPHNSGHLTIDACVTSQFEQQVRCVCGLPLGDPALVWPAACMVQVLGDLWFAGGEPAREPNWAAALADPQVKLHLYGKAEPRRGRKMGHLTALGGTADEAIARATAARRRLTGASP